MRKRPNESTGASGLQVTALIILFSLVAILFDFVFAARLGKSEPVVPALSLPVNSTNTSKTDGLTATPPCTDNTWSATNTLGAPSNRGGHTAVWTDSEMIVWGGFMYENQILNTGGRYNPVTNTWTATSTINAPVGRLYHKAVWTGSEMIVWGGLDGSTNLNTGGRYNPVTNTWSIMSTTNVPAPRAYHAAVWTGSEMIVWGGTGASGNLNTGGRYDPAADSWTATSTTNAPTARVSSAVWTGSNLIVWGGTDSVNYFDNGARYDPHTDSWAPTSAANAPARRGSHTAVWTGGEMVVWGGYFDDGIPTPSSRQVTLPSDWTRLSTGGRYCAQAPLATPTPPPSPTPTPTATTTPSPAPGLTPTPTPSPSATPLPPTPSPVDCGGRATISGSVFNCSSPAPTASPPASPTPMPLVADVMITAVSGFSSYSTFTDASGNYSLSVPVGPPTSFTVTPSKGPPLAPGFGSINTTDVLTVLRHFLGISIIPSGCRYDAADANTDGSITTVDAIAIQRFYLGLTTGIAATGQFKFLPNNRSVFGVMDCSVASGTNFAMYIVGDVAAPFGNRPIDGMSDSLAKEP